MSEFNLERLHNALLIIMDEVDRLCRKNDINYSLYGGTLIGAVRHKGFIPWDDDLDIAMLREDYERFLQVCNTQLGHDFRIITLHNKENYGYSFAKVTLKGTKAKQGTYTKLTDYSEVWVDVFPVDVVPSNGIRRLLHKYTNYFLIKMLEERYDGLLVDDTDKKKIAVFKCMGVLNRIIPAHILKKALVKNCMKYRGQKTGYISSMASHYGYDRETIPESIFDGYMDMEFEGRHYQAVCRYDAWLRKIFGDYMVLPPADKRHTHGFIELDLGEYK